MKKSSRMMKMVETLYVSAASVCSEVLSPEKKQVRMDMIHAYAPRKIKKLHIYRVRLEEMKYILEQMQDTYSGKDRHKNTVKQIDEIIQLLDEQNVLLMQKITALENPLDHGSLNARK